MTLPSNPKSVARVEPFLKKVNHSAHLDEIQFHKVMISLTEAVNNAIIHGNRSNPGLKVGVTCEFLPGWLLILVNDQGHGFRVEDVRNPLRKENLHRETGRGIFLMRTLMDKVEFELMNTGLQVRLWLDLNKQIFA